jgi:hypothetical protein
VAAKTVNQFLEGKVLSPYVIALCRDLWNAATDAAVEKLTASNTQIMPCSICGKDASYGVRICFDCNDRMG